MINKKVPWSRLGLGGSEVGLLEVHRMLHLPFWCGEGPKTAELRGIDTGVAIIVFPALPE